RYGPEVEPAFEHHRREGDMPRHLIAAFTTRESERASANRSASIRSCALPPAYRIRANARRVSA
ncbi:hypothetical protein, partial [Hyphomonas sp.]|uniref:hypothetical protein n=1 Tax=Hyphomonas sp. TaxID=87 RepID=UPI0037BFEFC2